MLGERLAARFILLSYDAINGIDQLSGSCSWFLESKHLRQYHIKERIHKRGSDLKQSLCFWYARNFFVPWDQLGGAESPSSGGNGYN